MTTRILLATVLVALCLPSALAQADNTRLIATVGRNDSFTISLRDASGNQVTHLDPGTYDIAVSDLSEMHQFHLRGPGVDVATPVEVAQEVTWTVTFSDGTYVYQCDPHASTMQGYFTVGNVPAVAVSASVGPGRRISLKPKTFAPGPVALTVIDRSKIDNFHLTGPGVNKKTGVAFRGRVKWNLTLGRGSYLYRSDKHPRLRGAFSVKFPA